MLRVLLISIATSTLTASATTIVTSVVLLVSVLLTALTRLVVLLRSLSLGAILVLLLVSTHLTEEGADELFGLSVLTALSFLLLLFFGYPHLNSDGLGTAKEVLLIESLDSLLSVADSIVHNVSVLGLHLVFVDFLDRGVQLERNDLGILSKGELLSQFFLSNL